MNKTINFVKANFEFLNYIILSILLFLGCFFEIAIWLLLFYAVLICFFYNYEKIFALYLYLSTFIGLFSLSVSAPLITFDFFTYALCTIILVKYIYEIIKFKEKLNLKTLIPILVFSVFLVLPIHNLNAFPIIKTILFFLVLYVINEKKEKISLSKIVFLFSLGLIVSSFFALFKSISPRLMEIIPSQFVENTFRFSGLFLHTNNFALHTTICLSLLFFLRYQNKISTTQFLLLFTPIFIFTYLTLSRNFIFAFIIVLLLFLIFYLIKNKKKSLKFMLVFGAVLLISVLCCFNTTKVYMLRIISTGESITDDVEEDTSYQTDEWWEDVYNGEIKYDPGRFGIWEMYLKDFSSSANQILFGKGVGSVGVGQMAAHNLFIETLWRYGVIGYLLILGIIISFIDFKKLKGNFKAYASLLLIILPYFCLALFESTPMDLVFYVPVILAFFEILKKKDEKKKVLYYNTCLDMGGTEVYMVNLIESMDKSKFDFDVLIKSSKIKNQILTKRLEDINVKINYLGKSFIIQMINSLIFFLKNSNKFDIIHINATSQVVGIFAFFGSQFGNIQKVIFHSHMGGNDNKENFTDKIGLFLVKNFATNLVSCSDKASEFMFKKKIAESGKVTILNNAIDLDKFRFNIEIRNKYRKELDLENNFVILNIGRFVPQKNQEKLVEIFNSISKKDKSAKLVFVGVGDLQETIRTKVSKLNLDNKVLFLNERKDVNCILQASDVFVMTSIHEGLPIVAVEAQASGLPLILSDSITHKTDITGNCVFVKLSENNEIWAKRILDIKKFERKDTSEKIIQAKFDKNSAKLQIEKLYLGE